MQEILKRVAAETVKFTVTDLLERIQDRYRWPKTYVETKTSNSISYSFSSQPSIECINPNGTKHQNFFLDDGYVYSDRVLKYYEDGYTLILSKVQYLFPDIIKITDILNEVYNDEINANIYFGKGISSVSFPEHNHPYPVVVKNIAGDADWIVGDKLVNLKNQEALFLEPYQNHAVTYIRKPKMSLTFNMGTE